MNASLASTGSWSQTDSGRVSPVVWLYLISLVLPIQFSIGPLTLMPTRLLLLFVFVPLMANLFSGKYGKILWIDILFMLHMAWAAIAIGLNNPEQVIQYTGSTNIEFLGGYMVARAYIRTPAQFQKLIYGLLLLNVALLPFSLVELRTGTAIVPSLIAKVPGLRTVAQVTYEKRMGLERVQNAFAHPIHYGLFCSMAFTLVLVGLKGYMSDTLRRLGTIAVFAGVFMGLSSGPLLATFLQIGLMAWAWTFRKIQRKWLLLLGLFAFMWVFIDLLSNRGPTKVIMSYATFDAQTAYYRAAINDWGWMNVWDNPIFGLGLREWIRPAYMLTGSVDNFWLVMAMRYGLPGLVFVAVGYALGLWQVGRRNFTGHPVLERLRFAWVVTFACLAFTLVTVHVWTAIYTFVFFAFGAGMWMITWQPDESAGAEAAPADRNPRRLTYSRSAPAPATAASPVRGALPAAAASLPTSLPASLPAAGSPPPSAPASAAKAQGDAPPERKQTAYTRFAPRNVPRPVPPRTRRS